MTGKQTQGAVAYDGTGALKMAAPEAPAQKKKFRKKETKGKKETKETQHPVVKNGAALLTKGARWTVPGAILAILTVALVVVITLASYAQLVVVNDKVVELRNELSELQSEETQLKAQYELAYDLYAGALGARHGGVSPGLGPCPADHVLCKEPCLRGEGIFLSVEYIRLGKKA